MPLFGRIECTIEEYFIFDREVMRLERRKNGFGIAAKSLTEAMKMKDIFAKNGIGTTLVRTPNSGKGCGYSLYIKAPDVKKAHDIMRRSGYSPGGEI